MSKTQISDYDVVTALGQLESPATGQKCNTCMVAVLVDEGYSDYTVEGTSLHCTQRKHPNKGGFDIFYGDALELDFATECDGFVAGGPGAHLCVDYPDNCVYTEDELALVAALESIEEDEAREAAAQEAAWTEALDRDEHAHA